MAQPFSLDVETFREETKIMAQNELREKQEIVEQARAELRELLRNDTSIQFADDDDFLNIYLRPTKFYPKSALELMKRIADFREKYKNILADLMPEDEKEAFTNEEVVNILKGHDHKGRRVLIVNVGEKWDTSKVTTDQVFRMFYLIHQAAVLEPETQVRGVVVLMDFHGLGRKQAGAFSPAFSLKLLSFIQDAMPLRLKEVHIVKEPFLFNIIWTIFKPFIKSKLRGRLHFHGTKMESLHKFLAPSHLPKDYGGDLPAIDYSGANWYPAIDNYTEHIKKMNSCGLRKKS